jgi:hypothetical protein
MALRKTQIASGRIGTDEWRIEFVRVAGGIWELEAYKTGEAPAGKPNLFWSQLRRRFAADTRLDVPGAMLERTVAWIQCVAEQRGNVRGENKQS